MRRIAFEKVGTTGEGAGMLERLKIYREGLSVERLHTVPHIQAYNNGYHSANAALIAYELCKLLGVDSGPVVLHMLLHDVPEGYTGDIPGNFKDDNPIFTGELNIIEHQWVCTNIPDLPLLNAQQINICKLADIIELGFYCVDEIEMGNRKVVAVLDHVVDSMTDYQFDHEDIRDVYSSFIEVLKHGW